jgi:AhpD family alkylhydroperoxidase
MSATSTTNETEAAGGCTPDGGCIVTDTTHARMAHPALVVAGAMPALQAVAAAIHDSGLSERTIELVNLRVSQINGCGGCLLGHTHIAKKNGETDDRIAVVAGWRDAPLFTKAERAALALAEAVTRLSDRSDPVSDDVWDEAARHYDEPALGALVLAIANINVWNRLNVTTRQVAATSEW